ncbi:hypothetical protein WJX72_007592 [[Myrmecia] bisecta]|uniref:Ribonuclease n=1 Tax=[Myrmecia] bisecta TaxID=41462 RepID=A0AAW1Q245_9CHLO
MGIDEAGRGPVLGPMVYGCAYCPMSLREALSQRSFADSKTLTEDKRDTLFAEIKADPMMGFAVDCLSAKTISAQMLHSERGNLNTIANESTYRLIEQTLALGVNLQEVYVDTVGDPDRWQDRLSQRYTGIKFTVCPKADSLYPIVSAASIAAKVTRDTILRDFPVEEAITVGRDFGSGYPGDPITKAWLVAHLDRVFGFPSLVRFSWTTCSRLLDECAIPVKWECDQVESQQQTLTFGGLAAAVSDTASCATKRHSYFRARRLQRVATAF